MMKSDVSEFASMNPREVRYVANWLYQARGAKGGGSGARDVLLE
jgi:hypothetical protein